MVATAVTDGHKKAVEPPWTSPPLMSPHLSFSPTPGSLLANYHFFYCWRGRDPEERMER